MKARVKRGGKPVETLEPRQPGAGMPHEALERRSAAFQRATSTPKERGGCKAAVYGAAPKKS